MPQLVLVPRDELIDADTAGKPAFPLRRLRIRGRTFRHSVDILPPLPAADETSSERRANSALHLYEKKQMVYQEPFVIAAAIEVAADASDLG